MRSTGRFIWWSLAVSALLSGCTDAGLQPPRPEDRDAHDNLLTIKGELCTRPDSQVVFPVKVLFAIDQSYSLQCTDSTNRRYAALNQLIGDLLENPATSLGFVGFSSWSRAQAFTRNVADIQPFLDPAAGLGQATDYQGALATAAKMLETDMINAGPAERARTRYVVVFMSDGVPQPRCNQGCEDDEERCKNHEDDDGDGAIDGADTDCANIGDTSLHPDNEFGACNSDIGALRDEGIVGDDEYVDMVSICPAYNQPEQILHRVSQILELQDTYSVGSVTLNTVLLFSPQHIVDDACPDASAGFGYDEDQARSLLRAMALEGKGAFRDANLGEIDNSFLDFDFRAIDAPQALRGLMAWNQHARLANGTIAPDADADGLADVAEQARGTDPKLADSDVGGGDGYTDVFETLLAERGFDALDPNIPAIPCSDTLDLDGDGLLDCEEAYLGTDPRQPDSDGDAVLDWIELVLGTEPTRNDGNEDLDFDGVLNAEEAFAGTNPAVPDADRYLDSAIQYRVVDLGRLAPVEGEEERECYEYAIRDIELVVTPLVPDRGLNRILIYGLEQPAQLASASSTTTVACFEAFYRGEYSKDPANGIIDVTQGPYYALLAEIQTMLDTLPTADSNDDGVADCGWRFDPSSFGRGDIIDFIDECMPDEIQLGRFEYPEDHVIDFLSKYVASNSGVNMPQLSSQMFVPLASFDPERDCFRPWELAELRELFARILSTCTCTPADPADENAAPLSPCCP